MAACDYVKETKKRHQKNTRKRSTPLGAFSKQRSQVAHCFFMMYSHDVYEHTTNAAIIGAKRYSNT